MNIYRKILIFVILLAMLASGCSKQASQPPKRRRFFFMPNSSHFRLTDPLTEQTLRPEDKDKD